MASFEDIIVEEYTTPSPLTVDELTNITEVAELMLANGVRHIPVKSRDKVIGILSERDLKMFSNTEYAKKFTAKDLMTEEPFEVMYNTPLVDVAFKLSEKKIGSAIVTDESGTLMGIFTVTDALNALIEVLRGSVES